MRIQLIAGRDFGPQDDDRAPGVVIVSETLARRMWPQDTAVGKRIKGPGLEAYSNQWLTVIGVVEDARYREIEGSRFDVYMPHAQGSMQARHLVVRTTDADPTRVAPDIRRIVRAIDPAAPVDELLPMQAIVDQALAGRKLRAELFSLLAALALVLAAVGVFSLLNYSVVQRRRELAVRVALGAAKGTLVRMVVSHGLRVALVGVALGLAGAVAASSLTASLLVRLSPRDPLTFVAATVLVVLIALVACYIPAGRAARANPIDALKT
jgi:putative ABC transport system permease protein